MKYLKKVDLATMFLLFISISFFTACSDDNTLENLNDDNTLEALNNIDLTQTEKDALVFMIEEEKLARDVYGYLYELWDVIQFQNIKQSEQSHMDAVENLLKLYEMEYTIMQTGIFQNTELQHIYNSLIAKGETSFIDALTVGAIIEDLDIKDLEDWMLKIDNPEINNVFTSLQCGSRNHLRAFTASLDNAGSSYIPEYITQSEYEQIINSNHEQCN